jgi:TonB family protein
MPRSLLPLLLALMLHAQPAANPNEGDPIRIGPGVTAPRVVRGVEPEYSAEARAAAVSGTVLLQLVVNENGRATDIAVLSPLGFGFDEKAIAALEKWELAFSLSIRPKPAACQRLAVAPRSMSLRAAFHWPKATASASGVPFPITPPDASMSAP